MALVDENGIAKIVLTNFMGARIMQAYDENDQLEEGVFIPLEKNGIKKGRTGKVCCYAFVTKTNYPSLGGWTHFLRLKVSPEYLRKLNSLGYETPYIGNFKNHNYVVFKNSYQQKLVKAKDYE